jgi:hypothetical protein
MLYSIPCSCLTPSVLRHDTWRLRGARSKNGVHQTPRLIYVDRKLALSEELYRVSARK